MYVYLCSFVVHAHTLCFAAALFLFQLYLCSPREGSLKSCSLMFLHIPRRLFGQQQQLSGSFDNSGDLAQWNMEPTVWYLKWFLSTLLLSHAVINVTAGNWLGGSALVTPHPFHTKPHIIFVAVLHTTNRVVYLFCWCLCLCLTDLWQHDVHPNSWTWWVSRWGSEQVKMMGVISNRKTQL